jgi:hypothetical protein
MSDIVAGTYTARLIDYGMSTSKDEKTVVVMLRFEFGEGKRLWWSRPIKDDKMLDVIAKTLAVCGYEQNDFKPLYDSESKAFPEKDVEVVVEMNEYNGTMRPQISFINEIGSGGFKRIAADQGRILTAGFNISAALAAARGGRKPEVKAVEVPF